MGLEASCAAGCVVEGDADDGFAVVDLVCGDEGKDFGEGQADDIDLFVILWLCCSDTDVAGEVDLHPFAEEAGAGEVFGEEGPFFGAVSGLFDHLAAGGGEGGFAGFDTSGGEFDEVLSGGVAVLTFEDDDGVGGIAGLGGFVYGEDDDGAVVADDVAGVAVAVGLDNLVGEDGKDLALVGEFGGEELGFGGGGPFCGGFGCGFGCGASFGGGFCFGLGGGGFVGGSGHIATVSSCIAGDAVGILWDVSVE